MKRAMGFGLIGLIGLICGCGKGTNAEIAKVAEVRRESDYKLAERNIRQECTNMVGFRRILSSGVLRDGHPEVTNWTGWARVEIINKNGGVEAQSVDFKFLGVGFDGPIASPK